MLNACKRIWILGKSNISYSNYHYYSGATSTVVLNHSTPLFKCSGIGREKQYCSRNEDKQYSRDRSNQNNSYSYNNKYRYSSNNSNDTRYNIINSSCVLFGLTNQMYINNNNNGNSNRDNEHNGNNGIKNKYNPHGTTNDILEPQYLTPSEAIRIITGESIGVIESVIRLFKLGIIMLPSIVTLPIVFIPGINNLWWRLLLESIQFSGTCWIKFGQWISTRPDLFPKLLCDKFSLLHNMCPAHSDQFTIDSIESNFGKSIEELFLYFDTIPMASGAVAQVHKAVIHDGSVVVVKVLHPNVKHYIKTDFTIIYTALWVFSQIPGMKWLSLPESVLEFGKSMMKQVDLNLEANHLSTFINNFKNNTEVVFPKPCYPLVSKDVLVETFEPGQPIMEYIETNSPYNPTLARIGLDAYMQMMLVDNFIHADLHPGNVLVRDPTLVKRSNQQLQQQQQQQDNSSNSGIVKDNGLRNLIVLSKIDLIKKQMNQLPKLVLLDVGLVTELEDQDKSHFRELFTEVVKGDGKAGAELIIKYAREAQCTEEEIYEFKEKMGEIFNKVQRSKLSEVHVGHLLGEILSLVREYHVKLESNFATLVMGTIILEGLGKQLDPNLNLLKAAIPFLFHRQTGYILPEFFRFIIRPQKPFEQDKTAATTTTTTVTQSKQ